ncbi:MAG TPA: glycoside hydrolase, partial [Clostridium sp.]|nr:glycoside hydrolase [Clostridium sp.]
PGDDVVDIVGYDKYNAKDGLPNGSAISSTFYNLVQLTGGKKLVAMTENDTIPRVQNLIDEMAGWLYFCPWYDWWIMSEQNNPSKWVKEMYQSDYCITLDELPDLKTYPISGYNPPEEEEPSEEPEIIYGDLNNDTIINSNDAVLLSRYILEIIGEFSVPMKTADLNGDETVNSVDYTLLKRYLLEVITQFPL